MEEVAKIYEKYEGEAGFANRKILFHLKNYFSGENTNKNTKSIINDLALLIFTTKERCRKNILPFITLSSQETLAEVEYIDGNTIDFTEARAFFLLKKGRLFIVGKGKLRIYPTNSWYYENDEEIVHINKKISFDQLGFLLGEGFEIVDQDKYNM